MSNAILSQSTELANFPIFQNNVSVVWLVLAYVYVYRVRIEFSLANVYNKSCKIVNERKPM